jgi:dihydrofolate synthase/folylpolyglutamate synthase
MDYLGPDRESIGFEKAGILRPGKPAVISDPMPPASLLRQGQAIGADLWLVGRDFSQSGDRQQWSWAGRGRRYNALAYPALRGANQLLNASGVLAVFEALRECLPVSAQAVRSGLSSVALAGRFQIVPGQPALVLDVAHNPHAVSALAYNLDQMGFFPRTHAVFGAMRDKDIAGMLARIAPLVEHWYLSDLPVPRAAAAIDLALALKAIAPGAEAPPSCHAQPADALRAALAAADPADRIVVFGSFLCVGGVLKDGLPRLGATHSG